MPFAQRTQTLKPEGAYHVLARAQHLEAQGREIIHLEIGQPDFDTFEPIRAAGIAAIDDGHTRYNPPAGIPELRAAIAEDAGRRRGLEFSAEQVVVSPGAKPNLFFPVLALVEPGDEVIYPDPGFPTYAAMIRVAGGNPVPVPLDEQRGFSFDMQAFKDLVNERTRLIILNSPGNPTGGVMKRTDLEQVAAAAHKHDSWIISDEIYSRLHYLDGDLPTILALPGMESRTILVDGFSKTYAMTGWRLGYGIMPVDLAERVALLLTHSIGCTAHFTQYAGLNAITGSQEEVEAMVAVYRSRRDLLVEGLNAIHGVSCAEPQGAFYAFPNVSSFGLSSSTLADRILEEAGVALLSGTSFGKNGEGYLRISYANSMANIERAINQLAEFFSAI
ncbi:MAG: pyridoxal phosphate-dependent aminotransferase [Anaerolineales bacterium]|jgi:aspartate/methionine/tyrosine aminotransferase